MTKPGKTLLRTVIAAIVGGIVGGSLAANHHQIAHTLFHFSPAMLAAIALICFFSIFWSAISKNSAPTQSSESQGSRQFHLIVLNLGVLILILPIPGLTRQILPARHILEIFGLL